MLYALHTSVGDDGGGATGLGGGNDGGALSAARSTNAVNAAPVEESELLVTLSKFNVHVDVDPVVALNVPPVHDSVDKHAPSQSVSVFIATFILRNVYVDFDV